MSTRKGEHGRKRPQKHQNHTAWNPAKNKTDARTKNILNLRVINCCAICTDKIQWKIKYASALPICKLKLASFQFSQFLLFLQLRKVQAADPARQVQQVQREEDQVCLPHHLSGLRQEARRLRQVRQGRGDRQRPRRLHPRRREVSRESDAVLEDLPRATAKDFLAEAGARRIG